MSQVTVKGDRVKTKLNVTPSGVEIRIEPWPDRWVCAGCGLGHLIGGLCLCDWRRRPTLTRR